MAGSTNQNHPVSPLLLADRWGKQGWIAVAIATAFFVLSLGFSIWSFTLDCLKPHQQWLLNIFLPILGALAATFVSGAIVVTVRERLDAVSASATAAGGLAIWLILYLTSPGGQANCQNRVDLRVIDTALLNEEHITRQNGTVQLAKLEKRQFNNLDLPKGRERVFLYGLIEAGEDALRVPDSTLVARAVVYFGDAKTDSILIWELSSLDAWQKRPLVQAIGLDRVKMFLNSQIGVPPPGKRHIPILAILSCLDGKNWPGGIGHIEIHANVVLKGTKADIPIQSVAASGTCRD